MAAPDAPSVLTPLLRIIGGHDEDTHLQVRLTAHVSQVDHSTRGEANARRDFDFREFAGVMLQACITDVHLRTRTTRRPGVIDGCRYII